MQRNVSKIVVMILLAAIMCLGVGCVRGGAASTGAETSSSSGWSGWSRSLAPWEGDVRLAMNETTSYAEPEELAVTLVDVVKGLLEPVGVAVDVECLEVSAIARQQGAIHARMKVTFPDGGKVEQRQRVEELMASLAPTTAAYEGAEL